MQIEVLLLQHKVYMYSVYWETTIRVSGNVTAILFGAKQLNWTRAFHFYKFLDRGMQLH